MKSVTKTQIALLAGSVIVIVLLLFANTTLPKKEGKPEMSDHAGTKSTGTTDISKLVDGAKIVLNADQKQTFEKLEEALKTSTDKKEIFGNIIHLWDSLRQPAIAAYYTEQWAIASPTEKSWNDAGNRYYAATRFAKEPEKPMLYHKAMECFEKTLELNPKNIEAKINLAACYVEGSEDPMKGIGLLREVEKTDSNNVNLQLNFAFFSEKSGQWDKAIARFNKVLKIQPDFIEAYLHLADAYEQKGDKAKAIENLRKYSSLIDDVTIKTEIEEYIKKLSQG